MPRFLVAAVVLLASAAVVHGADLITPISPNQLDSAAFAEWFDGAEHAIQPKDDRDKGHTPQWVIWTSKTAPGHNGIEFGKSASPGPRHLRIGFTAPISAGAILVRGGVQVSVLKPDAKYPGDLADDSQWIAAQRIDNGKIDRTETGRENDILWTLPAAVQTRAIRFTHLTELTSREYAGWLGGAAILSQRVANLAPQAMPVASADSKEVGKLINESQDAGWGQWCNFPLKGGERADVVSPEKPEWVMLAWPGAVKLGGVGLAFAGFADADAQIYTGPADVHPREAPESAWKTVKTISGIKNGYPGSLPIDWIDFGSEVTTRAVRIRITKGLQNGGHPHMQEHPKSGKRVWLGEILVLSPVADNTDLATAIIPKQQLTEQPPIPVKFSIPEAGWVTLVIEDNSGKRVRNLIADTFFEKGEHTVGWDGSDDLGRDPSAAKHGLYYIPARLVEPGTYRVRGLWRSKVDAKYEMPIYTAGTVPWETADKSGGWLANHSAPSAVLFVPDCPTPDGKTKPTMLIGSYVSEGTAGLAWVDLDGKKWRGQGWVGGLWTGAPHLARDAGPKAIKENYAYVAAAWSAGDGKKKLVEGEIRITALTAKEDKTIIKFPFKPNVEDAEKVRWEDQIGGIAVRDGVIAVSLPATGEIVLVDAASGKISERMMRNRVHGLAFDGAGRLLAIQGTEVIRLITAGADDQRPIHESLVTNLDDPMGLTLDDKDNLYISERGKSHDVKMYASVKVAQAIPPKPGDQYRVVIEKPEWKLVRTFGKPGVPTAGPYDPNHINNPRGLAIDPNGRLWIAEEDAQPKRVSVWNPDGTLAKAFYGPAEYGGGGSVDPRDKTKLYYNGMEFHLDFEKGTSQLASVFYRPTKDDLKLPFRDGVPQNALYHDNQRFWTNAFNSNPTGGHGTAFIFADRNGIAVPCAGFGRANEWPLLSEPQFAAVWPAGSDPKANAHTDKAATFLWQDLNADGHVQPNEVSMLKGTCGGVVVQSDLAFVVSRLGGKSVRFAPTGFTKSGVPTYDMSKPQTLVEDANAPVSSGGDQALVGPDGWSIHTNAPKPFSAAGIGGARNGVPMWSYPSLWPGLHASHEAPVPDHPGEVIGHTRLLGDWIMPRAGEPMFLVNGNTGPMYVFTYDGLFVTQLFQDMRVGRPWHMPAAQRGMVLNELTPSDENFWPNVTQTKDGVYLVMGGKYCLAKIDGLESVQRLPVTQISLTPDDLNKARDYFARAEAARQAAQGRGVMTVTLRKTPPKIDGKPDDWATADWAEIDKRGTRAYFNSTSDAYNVTGAVAIAGDKLYACWRTADKDLLKNAGDVPMAPFKTGGALDLMIGSSDASVDDKRMNPIAGDIRLLITQTGGKLRALVYRPAVAKGEAKQPIPFSSPGRTITFDRVDDVSDQVQLATDGEGNYEISISLSAISLKPAAGKSIRADIGILRGNGATTTQRVYWSNKATTIVADVPSEAELRPGLWGRWEFKAE
jgi:hypothetical protein